MAKINFKVPSAVETPYDVARSYIAAGIAVFPCHEAEVEEVDQATGEIVTRPEKSPYTSNGLKGATRSERIVGIWFNERHPNALIGLPTGEPLGAWVLDLDRHGDRDGHAWLAKMEAKHGPLPETARARTANGGTHVFFKNVDGIRNRAAIAHGVDTRGQDGYIVGPGSVMADGRKYEWIDDKGNAYEPIGIPDFADTPQWLLDLLLPKKEAEQPRRDYTYTQRDLAPYVNTALESEISRLVSATVGSRGSQLNASAYSLGQLVGAGVLSREIAEDELYRGARSNGVLQKDGEKQTLARIKRGLDDGIKVPRVIKEREYENDNTKPVDTSKLLAKKKQPDVRVDAQDEAPSEVELPNEQAMPKKRERFDLTWFDNIKDGEPKVTFIKGVFGEREFTTISGLPGTGKSVIVTDMACHVACGKDWHGRRVKPGLVIYVAAERKKLTERRMMAFRKEHGVENVPLLVIGGRLDFTKDLKDVRDLIAEIKKAEIETGTECVWVIIDTLTRVFGGGDQNASKDMTKFVSSCDEILMETKAHVTAIHHSSWSGDRGKGAIDLDGAVDASFMVKKSGGSYKLVCDGTNDGEEGEVLAFAMKSVELGVDEDGEPTTAPVVLKVASDNIAKGLAEATTHKDRALVILREMQEEGEMSPGMHGLPEDTMLVPEESWRQAFYDALGDAPQPTKQATFVRVKKSLLKSGSIGESGIWVWTPNKSE
ncbi:bifunctional DNA primase/polymerase [Mesorhizobium sp.]|uniref:bifunctional DNA primase/polymerase n=1 Tax=Mesorhizobium sp. TaxID=1871066 RepID=UPI0011FD235B|nr:bifunctional DNA primase/polymerase [Mesorhizobium sp.]TIN83116.1 MAG: hypothetical protein E5X97_27690 [Mesorhizobium sp.]